MSAGSSPVRVTKNAGTMRNRTCRNLPTPAYRGRVSKLTIRHGPRAAPVWMGPIGDPPPVGAPRPAPRDAAACARAAGAAGARRASVVELAPVLDGLLGGGWRARGRGRALHRAGRRRGACGAGRRCALRTPTASAPRSLRADPLRAPRAVERHRSSWHVKDGDVDSGVGDASGASGRSARRARDRAERRARRHRGDRARRDGVRVARSCAGAIPSASSTCSTSRPR